MRDKNLGNLTRGTLQCFAFTRDLGQFPDFSVICSTGTSRIGSSVLWKSRSSILCKIDTSTTCSTCRSCTRSRGVNLATPTVPFSSRGSSTVRSPLWCLHSFTRSQGYACSAVRCCMCSKRAQNYHLCRLFSKLRDCDMLKKQPLHSYLWDQFSVSCTSSTMSSMPRVPGFCTLRFSMKGTFTMPSLMCGTGKSLPPPRLARTTPAMRARRRGKTRAFFRPLGAMHRAIAFNKNVKRDSLYSKCDSTLWRIWYVSSGGVSQGDGISSVTKRPVDINMWVQQFSKWPHSNYNKSPRKYELWVRQEIIKVTVFDPWRTLCPERLSFHDEDQQLAIPSNGQTPSQRSPSQLGHTGQRATSEPLSDQVQMSIPSQVKKNHAEDTSWKQEWSYFQKLLIYQGMLSLVGQNLSTSTTPAYIQNLLGVPKWRSFTQQFLSHLNGFLHTMDAHIARQFAVAIFHVGKTSPPQESSREVEAHPDFAWRYTVALVPLDQRHRIDGLFCKLRLTLNLLSGLLSHSFTRNLSLRLAIEVPSRICSTIRCKSPSWLWILGTAITTVGHKSFQKIAPEGQFRPPRPLLTPRRSLPTSEALGTCSNSNFVWRLTVAHSFMWYSSQGCATSPPTPRRSLREIEDHRQFARRFAVVPLSRGVNLTSAASSDSSGTSSLCSEVCRCTRSRGVDLSTSTTSSGSWGTWSVCGLNRSCLLAVDANPLLARRPLLHSLLRDQLRQDSLFTQNGRLGIYSMVTCWTRSCRTNSASIVSSRNRGTGGMLDNPVLHSFLSVNVHELLHDQHDFLHAWARGTPCGVILHHFRDLLLERQDHLLLSTLPWSPLAYTCHWMRAQRHEQPTLTSSLSTTTTTSWSRPKQTANKHKPQNLEPHVIPSWLKPPWITRNDLRLGSYGNDGSILRCGHNVTGQQEIPKVIATRL